MNSLSMIMKNQLCTVELQKSSGHAGKPQNHKLFTVPVCGLLLCSPIGFLMGKNSTRVSRVHFFLSFSLKLPTNLRWSVRIEILYRGSQSRQENIMNVARISKTYPQRRRWATHIAPLVCLWGACGPELQQRGIFSIVYNRSFIWKKTISVLRRRKWWDLNERWTTTVKFS